MAEKSPAESRRDFLRRLPGRMLVATAGAWGAREVLAAVRGHFSDFSGNRFQPLYERHDIGPGKELSPQATGVWIESNYFDTAPDGSPINIYNLEPNELARILRESPGGKVLTGSDRLISAVQERQLPLAVGDIVVLEVAVADGYEEQRQDRHQDEDEQQFRNAVLLLLAAQSPGLLQRFWQRSHPGESQRIFDRRTALKLLGAALAYGGTALAFRQASETLFLRQQLLAKNVDTPEEKILLRLFGLGVHTRPEEPLDFGRNVVMAIKIKMFTQWQKDQGIDQPFTGFEVGTRHGGIEDLLLLPLPFLEELAVLTSEKYLRQAGKYFGADTGVVRIIQADEVGSFRDVGKLVNQRLASFGRSEHGIPQELTAPLFPTIERPPKKKK